jgi:uroporphyrinogen decarboxylase
MTKRERVLATLRREETDRVPYSVYVHSDVHSRGVERFVDFTLDFYRRYDPDYVKVMFDENYDTPVDTQFMRDASDWRLLEELDAHLGAFGRQIEVLKRVKEAVGPDVPVIQTIYNPFHIGIRLAARRILEDLRENPDAVELGLAAIAASTARFAEAAVEEAGVDGFFLGAIGAEEAWLTREAYTRHAMPADKLLLPSLRKAPILIVHIHGEKGSYFDLLSGYECDALSWEDRLAGPSLTEARGKSERCFVGGVNHAAARTATPQAIVAEARESIRAAGARGLILAPGCTLAGDTPPANILAFKEAVGA